jgi:hypothetical protein
LQSGERDDGVLLLLDIPIKVVLQDWRVPEKEGVLELCLRVIGELLDLGQCILTLSMSGYVPGTTTLPTLTTSEPGDASVSGDVPEISLSLSSS